MRSLDYYYCLSLVAIVLCAFVMTNKRFSVRAPHIRNILIVGCNLEAAYLSSLLHKNKCLNVTVIDEGECSRENTFTFIQGSTFSKRLVDSINFKYSKIPDSHGFWNGQRLQRMNESPYRNIYRYGLSEYALRHAQSETKKQLHRLSRQSFESIEQLFGMFRINPKSRTLQYLLYELGLDSQYVRDVVYPFLYGHYLHEMQLNLLAAMLKLLELFNPSYEVIGTESDIVHRLLGRTNLIQQEPLKEIVRNDTTNQFTAITATLMMENISAVIYCNGSKDMRQWHYVTEIKGQLDRKFYGLSTEDADLPFSVYSPDGVAMIRKWCQNCRRANQHRYFLRSKFRLADRDLKMFQSHEILNSSRVRTVKFLQPQLGKLTDGLGSYYPNIALTVTDSRQLTLAVIENVARMLL